MTTFLLLATLAIASPATMSNFASSSDSSDSSASQAVLTLDTETRTFVGTGLSQEAAYDSAKDVAKRTIGSGYKIVSASYSQQSNKHICTLVVSY